ncbi:hypothetical protein HDV03_004913 [Kappamyces sp. JEL0829]|nr:hypothetical protein HDV03_004913 [Kappamyces sp. JEL0829]
MARIVLTPVWCWNSSRSFMAARQPAARSRSRIPLVAGAAFLYLTSVYVSYTLYQVYKLPRPASFDPLSQQDNAEAFDQKAVQYDEAIGWDEWVMGMGSKRQSLVREARGKVLEAGATELNQRNLPYYDYKAIEELVLSDTSRPMLERALVKFRSFRRQAAQTATSFKVIDGHTLPLPDKSVDCVVQSFGICSMKDPVHSLQEMARVVRDDGRVLLLEHGRSHYEWLNDILDRTAAGHAKSWGCWWNRDVLALVRASGLEVDSCTRYHAGTTYLVKCRKIKTPH